jgi:hypothetical protein
MKRFLYFLIGCVAALFLSGCGAMAGVNSGGFDQRMPDGRSVPCVGDPHGLSCDWDHAK